MLIPGSERMVGGGKEGTIYIQNRASMGGYHSSDAIPQEIVHAMNGHIHGSPVFWNGPDGPTVYIWSEDDALKAFRWNGSVFSPTTPISQSTVVAASGVMPGGALSVSANGSAAGTGIVWSNMPFDRDANHDTVPGVLRAFDAQDLRREIWNSRMVATDDVGSVAARWRPDAAAP
jgi:hypothetical protein